MSLRSTLNERLTDYNIEGDSGELYDILVSDSMIAVTLTDVMSVLSESRTNYLLIAYGKSLSEAYENVLAKEKACKLVFIYFSPGVFEMKDLSTLLNIIGEDVILGYAKNDVMSHGVKLVMIFN